MQQGGNGAGFVMDSQPSIRLQLQFEWNGSSNVTNASFFFHPDYTVGFGFSPNQLLSQLMDFYHRF